MTGHKGRDDELMPSRCWCEAAKVLVRPEDVRDGLTRSCGKAGCRKPKPGGAVMGDRLAFYLDLARARFRMRWTFPARSYTKPHPGFADMPRWGSK